MVINMKHEIIEIAPNTWCLSEFKLVNCYLVEGNNYACLIDTGCGIGNLREVVKSITTKPLLILLTHAHPDHDGGIYQFKDCPIYLNGDDSQVIGFKALFKNFRKEYIESRGPVRFPNGYKELLSLVPDPLPNDNYEYIDLKQHSKIDLGNRILEVIPTPGHTKGSVSFLDLNTKILFSGDTFNTQIILQRQPNNELTLVQEYHNMVSVVMNRYSDFKQLAIGHDGVLYAKEIIKDYYELTKGLLNGSIVGEYKEIGFRKGDVAYLGLAELWYQCDA